MLKPMTLAISALTLAACASSPSQQFASNIAAAHKSGQPLVIYDLDMTPPGSGVYLGFINSSGREISQVDIQVEGFRDGHPVRMPDGKTVDKSFLLKGSLMDGEVYSGLLYSLASPFGDAVTCAYLTQVAISYKDGKTTKVDGDAARHYLTAQNNPHCGMEWQFVHNPELATH